MRFAPFVARRYLKAKRKQAFIGVISLVTTLGIILGVAALNIGLSVHNGMRSAFLRSLIGSTGLLTVTHIDWSEPGFDSADLEAIAQVLDEVRSVEAISFQVSEWSLITRGQQMVAPAQVKGIVPDQESKVNESLGHFVLGQLEELERSDLERPGIVLGYDLAGKLGVTQGDMVRLMVPKIASPSLTMRAGNLKQKAFEVVGIFRTGSSDLDQMSAYVLIESFMSLMGTDRIGQIQIKLKDIRTLDATKTYLRSHPDMPVSARVIDLRDINAGLLHALTLEKWGTTLIISLIMMIVALNMVSALIMLSMEKHRDIGIMKAMGASRRMILGVFVRHGMTLSVIGTFLGTALGVGLSIWADRTQLLKLDSDVYEVLNYLPFEVHSIEVAAVAIGSLLIAFSASIYPAFQAANLDPVEALRYE
ncbi:MAG: ABC transporter permease [Acidobacteria bacterium]|nr:ABC transporter permease [Acidobacteriota bacterium]